MKNYPHLTETKKRIRQKLLNEAEYAIILHLIFLELIAISIRITLILFGFLFLYNLSMPSDQWFWHIPFWFLIFTLLGNTFSEYQKARGCREERFDIYLRIKTAIELDDLKQLLK